MIEARIRGVGTEARTDFAKKKTDSFPSVEVVFVDTDTGVEHGAATYVLRPGTPIASLGDLLEKRIPQEQARIAELLANPPSEDETPPDPSQATLDRVAELGAFIGLTVDAAKVEDDKLPPPPPPTDTGEV